MIVDKDFSAFEAQLSTMLDRTRCMDNPTTDSRPVFFLRLVTGLAFFAVFASAVDYLVRRPCEPSFRSVASLATVLVLWLSHARALADSPLVMRLAPPKSSKRQRVVATWVIAPFLPLFEPVCVRFGLMQPACFSALPIRVSNNPAASVAFVHPYVRRFPLWARIPLATWSLLKPYVESAEWANQWRRFHVALDTLPVCVVLVISFVVFAVIPRITPAPGGGADDAAPAFVIMPIAIPVCLVAISADHVWPLNPDPTAAFVTLMIGISDVCSCLIFSVFMFSIGLSDADPVPMMYTVQKGACFWAMAMIVMYCFIVMQKLGVFRACAASSTGGLVISILLSLTTVYLMCCRSWFFYVFVDALGIPITIQTDFIRIADAMVENAPTSVRDRVRAAAAKALDVQRISYASSRKFMPVNKPFLALPTECTSLGMIFSAGIGEGNSEPPTYPVAWLASLAIWQLPAILFPLYAAFVGNAPFVTPWIRGIAAGSVVTGVVGLAIGIPRTLRLARFPQCDDRAVRDRQQYDALVATLIDAVSGALVPPPPKALVATVPPTVLPADVAEFVVGPFMHPEYTVHKLPLEEADRLWRLSTKTSPCLRPVASEQQR
jgi:hypothetical protein